MSFKETYDARHLKRKNKFKNNRLMWLGQPPQGLPNYNSSEQFDLSLDHNNLEMIKFKYNFSPGIFDY